MTYQWDFTPVVANAPLLAQGLVNTLKVTGTALACGLELGLAFALMRLSSRRWLSWPAGFIIEVFRTTPPLVQLFWMFFCLPVLFRISIPPALSVLLSLTMYMIAITSETFRGALKSIASEQHDACIALGLTPRVKVLYVIFPQGLLRAAPPLLSNVVSLFKESALISSVGIADLMLVGQNISTNTARPVEFLSAVGAIYFLVAFPLTRLVGVVETRMLRRYTY